MPNINNNLRSLFETLNNPPPHQEMLMELKMNNMLLKQKSGDIELFKLAYSSVLEKVWRSYKINLFLYEYMNKLIEMGLNEEKLEEQKYLIGEELDRQMISGESEAMDGFFKEGFLEIEVFRKQQRVKN